MAVTTVQPAQTPAPVLSQDIEQIIAATTRAVMDSYNARTLQRESVPHIPRAITTQSQSPSRQDMSFESFDEDKTEPRL